jgi:hypothetical protein
MQFRIHVVDGTLRSLYLDQVAASGCFKDVCGYCFKLTAALVKTFDWIIEVEGLNCALFDIGY